MIAIGSFFSDLARAIVSGIGTAPSAVNDPRSQAVAALCTQRGLVPGPILGPLVPFGLDADFFGFESSFVAPDGSLWAFELWTRSKTQSETSFYSMLMFGVPGVNMPYLAVARKGEIVLPGVSRGRIIQLESIDFDNRFAIRTEDQRSAMMLLDLPMMQWLLDCDRVSVGIEGDRAVAVVKRESTPVGGSDPTELQLALRFYDGFAARVPEILRTEYPAAS